MSGLTPMSAQGRRNGTMQGYLSLNISLKLADIPMLVCSFLSGLVDAVAFNAGAVFVSMQTGNTVFVALGAARLPIGDSKLWLRALISVGAFLAGCTLFSSASRLVGPMRRSTLFASFLCQALFLVVCASLAQSNLAPAFALSQLDPKTPLDLEEKHANEDQPAVYLIIALLAFQSSGQITLSRTLGFNEIPSVVMTSLYCDLLSDKNLLEIPLGANKKRNRRVFSVVLFTVGGIISGWLQRTVVGMAGTLWVAAGVKLIMACTWLCWREQAADTKNQS